MAEKYFDDNFPSSERYHLMALGLLQSGLGFSVEDEPVIFVYDGKKYEIRKHPEGPDPFAVAILTFTQVGVELFPLTNATQVPEYIDALKAELREREDVVIVEL